MPHKVSMADVEELLRGKIVGPTFIQELKEFLKKENQFLLQLTEEGGKSFSDPWTAYEPTLSRHLSRSSLNYITKVLEHPVVEEPMTQIEQAL